MSIGRKFFKYVSQNIFGMLGISCYVVADTFFISKFAGADGITVLNLVVYTFAAGDDCFILHIYADYSISAYVTVIIIYIY